MKRRIVSLGVALLMLLATMNLSACIDKSKWHAKEHGGAPNWQEERPDYSL